MDKLLCWRLIVASLIFGVGDRTINSIIHDYSIDSLAQIAIGGRLDIWYLELPVEISLINSKLIESVYVTEVPEENIGDIDNE